MKRKFSDQFASLLLRRGVRYAFSVTGGAVVHLLHSCENEGIQVIYAHHEQGAAYMAEGFARVSKNKSCCIVTTGPGGTNALTGLASSWTDSIPVIYISGQVRTPFLTFPGSVRQVGSQHLDITTIVRSISKEATLLVGDPQACLQETDNVINISESGRPGPVWIDVPLDLQEKLVECVDYSEELISDHIQKDKSESAKVAYEQLLLGLSTAKRPVFVIGFGAHLSGTTSKIVDLAKSLEIPIVLTWNTLDSIEHNSEINLGLMGVNGNRSANLVLFKSDFVAAFGSHLSRQLTGNNIDEFAPQANVLVLDIDALEVSSLAPRFRGLTVDLRHLFNLLETNPQDFLLEVEVTPSWKNLYKQIKLVNELDEFLNPDDSAVCQYEFYRVFNRNTKEGDIVVIDGGGNTLFSTHQNIKVKRNMRVFTGHGMGAMGSGIPHSIGAAFALAERNNSATHSFNRVFCFIGDGSFQFNIQELSVISYHKLPITVIVINNDGYLAIKNTEDRFFGKRFGVDRKSGIAFPSCEKISAAFGLRYLKLDNNQNVQKVLEEAGESQLPVILEVFVHENTPLIPRLDFHTNDFGVITKDTIYDMSPKLPPDIVQTLYNA